MHSGSNDKCDSPGWQTDPENPMLGPDGQVNNVIVIHSFTLGGFTVDKTGF